MKDVKSQGLYPEIRHKLKEGGLESLDFASVCEKESEYYTAITNLSKETLQDAHQDVEALVKYLAADRAFPILLSGVVCLDAPDFARLAKSVLSVIVRHSIFANLNPNDLENALYSAARAIRLSHKEGNSSSKSLQTAKGILNRINPSIEQITSGISEVFLTKAQAQLIIIRIAKKMQSETKAIGFDTTSLEHIFPENASEAVWPQMAKLEPYIWHIGNLTLLEPTFNRDAGNRSYNEKRDNYLKSEIVMANKIAHQYNDWGEKQILDRAKRLVQFIEQVWPVS